MTKLAFAQQPMNTSAHVVIEPDTAVHVLDENGNLVTTDNATSVTLSIATNAGPSGVPSGTLLHTALAGVATFSGLSIDLAGDGYTLEATSSTGLSPATSTDFDISFHAAIVEHRTRVWGYDRVD